ncbi:MAG: glycosyltransferase, partial [Zetaproteobacteria bacterium]
MLVDEGLISEEQLARALAEQKRTGQRLGDVLRQWNWVKPEEFYAVLLDSFRRGKIGELLVRKGLLTREQLDEALKLQRRWGTRIGDVLLAKGWVRPFDLYQVMAEHLGRPFINLMDEPVDDTLWDPGLLDCYAEYQFIPWRRQGDRVILAVSDPEPANLLMIEHIYKDVPTDFVITSKLDLHWSLQAHGRDYFKHRAVNKLRERQAELSASQVFTTPQLVTLYLFATALLAALVRWPVPTLMAINMALALFLLLNFGMRVIFAWVGSHESIDVKVTDEEVAALEDEDLPTYTILVPMYKEPEVLPIIAQSIREMDYPLSKIDVKLVLEEDDIETFEEAKRLGLEGIFEIIRVPPSLPKTKPKACNYALNFSRGELLTIYDAEDKPEPDQLKKVVVAFRKASSETAVIQARLNYFNGPENWLTKQFTIEYSLWFDFYLPALDALRIPIPLGGTSNHFRMKVLKEVDAWDPYNVTEDADLGVRLTQLNYRVGVVNSTTFEEANSNLHNWIRQRSRWLKGYMQTYLVHMRRPLHMYRLLGHVGFWGFQFFIGGTILSALIAPFLHGMYLFWLFTMTHAFDPLFSP